MKNTKVQINNNMKVLLVETLEISAIGINEEILNLYNIDFDRVLPENLAGTNLTPYQVIIVASRRKILSEKEEELFNQTLTTFANVGGIIIYGISAIPISNTPGGGATFTLLGYDAYIVRTYVNSTRVVGQIIGQPTHPIISGEQTGNTSINLNNLPSAMALLEDKILTDTIARGYGNIYEGTTLGEYPCGEGSIFICGLSWENVYNEIKYGNSNNFTKEQIIAFIQNLFVYGLSKANFIEAEGLAILIDFFVEHNSHHITVVTMDSAKAIEGAMVEIEGDILYSDVNGKVRYVGTFGKQMVKVSAVQRRIAYRYYNIQPRDSTFIFLEPDTRDGLPYASMVQEMENCHDVRTETIAFLENSSDMLDLWVLGEWGEHTSGSFMLYQEGIKDTLPRLQLISNDGRFNFAPGTTFNSQQPFWLKLIASNGVESKPIQLQINIFKGLYEDNGTLDFKFTENDMEVNVPEAKSASFGLIPSDFEFRAFNNGIKVFRLTLNDGTIIWRLFIGSQADISKGLNSSDPAIRNNTWTRYKKMIENLKDVKEFMHARNFLYSAQYPNLYKDHIKIQKPLTGEFFLNGFVEVRQDKTGNIKDITGGLLFWINGTFYYKHHFLAGPVPVYFDIMPSLAFFVYTGALFLKEEEGYTPQFDCRITAIPSIGLGAGVGVLSLASLGLHGEIIGYVGLLPWGSFILMASVKLRMTFIFIFDFRFSIVKFQWEKSWGKALRSLGELESDEKPEINLEKSLASRDYSKKTTGWNTREATNDFVRFNSLTDKIVMLQDWIMPSSVPQIIKVGSDLVILFQTDDITKSIGNNVVLMYSVYKNGVWSNPLAVWESETSDYFVKTLDHSGELHILWQKSKSSINQEDIDDMILNSVANSEICYAKWNSKLNLFENQMFITDNSLLDMMPEIVSNGHEITALWVQNSQNDIIGSTGTNTIYKRELLNGNWTESTIIHQTEHGIGELCAGYVNGSLCIVYNVIIDDTKSHLYLIENNIAKIIHNSSIATGLEFRKGKFYWSSEGALAEFNASSMSLNYISAGDEGIITGSYKLVQNSTTNAIVWINTKTVVDEEMVPDIDSVVEFGEEKIKRKSIYEIMACIETDEKFSNPIMLLSSETSIQTMDVELMEDDSWKVLLKTVEPAEGAIKDEDDMYSLVFADINKKVDTSLDYVMADSFNNVANNYTFEFMVTNNGQNIVSTLDLTIASDENVFLRKTVPVTIVPGQTLSFKEDVTIYLYSETEITVTASAPGEKDTTNNYINIILGQVDTSVTVMTYKADNNVIMSATVKNDSQIVANATLKLIEDSVDGTVLETVEIGRLDSSRDYLFVRTLDINDVDFKGSDVKDYIFKVETREKQLFNNKNLGFAAIYANREFEANNTNIQNINIVRVASISLNTASVNLYHDREEQQSSYKLLVNVHPTNATYSGVRWTSENEEVASVDKNGLITATGQGSTVISAISLDGEHVARCRVSVPSSGWNLSLTSSQGGSIVQGNGNYSTNDKSVRISAVANKGYRFTNWSNSPTGNNDIEFVENINSSTTNFLFNNSKYNYNLIANFDLIKVRVIYHANGGTGRYEGLLTAVNETATVLTLEETHIINNYDSDFEGWNTKADGSGTRYLPGETIKVDSNITLYAQWSVRITYIANGGTGSYKGPVTVPGETNIVLNLHETGINNMYYEFYAWNTEPHGGGTKYLPGEAIAVNSNIILYAQWGIRIKYDANGGTGSYEDSITVLGQTNIVLSQNQTGIINNNKEFDGWNTEADGSGTKYLPGQTIRVDSNVILYAQWSVRITYNANRGGTGSYKGPVTVPGQTNIVLSLQETGINNIYFEFYSWNTEPYGDGTKYLPGETIRVDSNITLYAQWGVRIKYDANGGTGTYEGPITLPGQTNIVLRQNQTGIYHGTLFFGGWNTRPDGTGIIYYPNDTIIVNNNVTLYAYWVISRYSIKYDGNGASGGSIELVASGMPYITLSPYQVGINYNASLLTFTSWNTRSDGSGIKYTIGQTITLNSDIVLYAQWL